MIDEITQGVLDDMDKRVSSMGDSIAVMKKERSALADQRVRIFEGANAEYAMTAALERKCYTSKAGKSERASYHMLFLREDTPKMVYEIIVYTIASGLSVVDVIASKATHIEMYGYEEIAHEEFMTAYDQAMDQNRAFVSRETLEGDGDK